MTPLHLDLLKEEERLSSSPIRLRVMLPMIASLLTLGLAVWWGLLALRAHNLAQSKNDQQTTIATLTPAHKAMLTLRDEEQEYHAISHQLQLYKNSRNPTGGLLSKLAETLPQNVQFVELRLTPPPGQETTRTIGPLTNTTEQVVLRIAGRTVGDRPINALLASLRSPDFTNLLVSAEIPKGAFRQDNTRNQANREALLFEITCTCKPRSFE